MIQVRCFRCSHAFQLSEQGVANALAVQGDRANPAHYVAECPRCRQAIKVPLRRVRLPPATALPVSEPLAEGTAGAAGEE